MPQCKLDVTLEPLSAAYLNQVERLWSDPAVIRYTVSGRHAPGKPQPRG